MKENEERYFNVKDANNLKSYGHIIKLTKRGLELLTGFGEELRDMEFRQNRKGKYVVNENYAIDRISKEQAQELLKEYEEWRKIQIYMQD